MPRHSGMKQMKQKLKNIAKNKGIPTRALGWISRKRAIERTGMRVEGDPRFLTGRASMKGPKPGTEIAIQKSFSPWQASPKPGQVRARDFEHGMRIYKRTDPKTDKQKHSREKRD